MAIGAFVAVSLDGFIARRNGSLDWLEAVETNGESDLGYADFISSMDALVLGRRSFEKVLSFSEWPYELPVFVLSRAQQSIPEHLRGQVESLALDPPQLVEHLEEIGHRNLYIDGGVTIQSFLAADLLEELTLTTVPILIGGGFRLFGDLERDLHFTLTDTRRLPGGLVQNCYRRS